MNKYIYTARDKSGRQVKGYVEAPNPQAAAKLVRTKGLIVVNIKKADNFFMSIINSFKNKVTNQDVTTFTRQLSTMINAGLPIVDALSILRTQSRDAMKKIIAQVLSDVEGGDSFSGALSKHKTVFSTTYIALIKAGETGGVLDKVLARLADNMEKDQEFKGKVKGALTYPAIVVVGMILVSAIMLIFVIPKLTGLYADFGAELPLPTRILMGISDFVVKFWWMFLMLIGVGVWFLIGYYKTNKGRRTIDGFYFKIPIFGPLQKEVIMAELTRTMALMVGAGVSILETLAISAAVVKNSVVSDAIKDAAVQIEKGFPIAYSFAKHADVFPFILSQMIAVGEETGKMEEVLGKISHVFEVESDQKVKGLTTAIEPIVMLLLGIGVGFLVISVILPIYNLTNKF